MKKKLRSNLVLIIQILFMLFVSVAMLLLEHPNKLNINGFAFLAWFVYIPLLFLIKKISLKITPLAGAIYGFLYGYFFYNWLKNYDSYGIYAITIYFVLVMCIFFLALKLVDILFANYAWLIHWVLISAFEYILTKGFMGLGFGVTAYTQFRKLALIQSCSAIGVFGLNALIIFNSCCLFAFFSKLIERRMIIYKRETDVEFYECNTHINYVSKYDKQLEMVSLKIPAISFAVFAVFLITDLIFGKIALKKDYQYNKQIKIAAIQGNEDPFLEGIDVYAKNVQILMAQTDYVLDTNPDVDIIVWPETAVVPSIVYQYNSKRDVNRYKLAKTLLDFINSRNALFVIGNGHREVDKNYSNKKEYNSALVFEPRVNVLPPEPYIYSKNHLVPFSECFPYERFFPHFYKFLLKIEPNMWTPGEEINVFEYKDLVFATPICFEDNFSDIGRKMYKAGARAFINLTNDSWSKSLVCQYEHLSMAVFRSVENKIPTVRSTISGQTCVISQNGEITKMAQPFIQSYIVDKIPVIEKDRKETIYTKIGDIFGYSFVFIFFFLLLLKIIFVIIKKAKK